MACARADNQKAPTNWPRTVRGQRQCAAGAAKVGSSMVCRAVARTPGAAAAWRCVPRYSVPPRAQGGLCCQGGAAARPVIVATHLRLVDATSAIAVPPGVAAAGKLAGQLVRVQQQKESAAANVAARQYLRLVRVQQTESVAANVAAGQYVRVPLRVPLVVAQVAAGPAATTAPGPPSSARTLGRRSLVLAAACGTAGIQQSRVYIVTFEIGNSLPPRDVLIWFQ